MVEVGKIITGVAERDAIHVAIAPVIAASSLLPGQMINVANGIAYADEHSPIGVVDPFLKNVLVKGDRFYLFLYPNTVTDMTHNWVHKSFPETYKQNTPIGRIGLAYVKARLYLIAFAKNNGDMTLEELIHRTHRWLAEGVYASEGGRFESCTVPDDFWDQYEIFTGRVAPSDSRYSFFSCSC